VKQLREDNVRIEEREREKDLCERAHTHSFVSLSTICLSCSFSARNASTSTPTGAPIIFFTYSTAFGGRSGSSYKPTRTASIEGVFSGVKINPY
jgi:hypothetical protein